MDLIGLLSLAFQPTPQPMPTSVGLTALTSDPVFQAIVFCGLPIVTLLLNSVIGLMVLSYTRRIKSEADSKDVKVRQEGVNADLDAARQLLVIDRERLDIRSSELTQHFASKTLESANDTRDAKFAAQASAADAAKSATALAESKAETAAIRRELGELKIASRKELDELKAASQAASDAKDNEISGLKKQIDGLKQEIERLKEQQVITKEDADRKDALAREELKAKDGIIAEKTDEIRRLNTLLLEYAAAAPSNLTPPPTTHDTPAGTSNDPLIVTFADQSQPVTITDEEKS